MRPETMLMRVLIATVLAVATVAVFCFVGALPMLLYKPVEGFQGAICLVWECISFSVWASA